MQDQRFRALALRGGRGTALGEPGQGRAILAKAPFAPGVQGRCVIRLGKEGVSASGGLADSNITESRFPSPVHRRRNPSSTPGADASPRRGRPPFLRARSVTAGLTRQKPSCRAGSVSTRRSGGPSSRRAREVFVPVLRCQSAQLLVLTPLSYSNLLPCHRQLGAVAWRGRGRAARVKRTTLAAPLW